MSGDHGRARRDPETTPHWKVDDGPQADQAERDQSSWSVLIPARRAGQCRDPFWMASTVTGPIPGIICPGRSPAASTLSPSIL